MTQWLALLVMLGPPVDLPTIPVSAHLQAMTVSQALNLIGKQALVSLSADDSLKSDIVLIRAQASLKDLGAELATVLDATWSRTNKGYVLSRTADALKAEEDRQFKYDSDAFARTQATLKTVDQSYGTWDEQAAAKLAKEMLDAQANANASAGSLRSLEVQAPVMRLFSRVIASLPPDDLAKIPPWGRVVYTTRPSRAQRPMPSDGAIAMLSFSQDQEIWCDAAADLANLNLSSGLASAKPFQTEPAKIFMILRRIEGSKLEGEMRIADSGGSNITVINGEIAPTPPPAALPPLPDPNGGVVTFPISNAMYQALRARMDIRQARVDSTLRPVMQNSETTDPLASFPAEVIDGATQKVAKNLVAVIPDEAYSLYDTLDLSGLTKGAIWSALADLGFEGTIDGQWLRLRPARMAASHEDRLDRVRLGELLRSATDGPTHIEWIEAVADSPGGITRTPLLVDTVALWSHSLSEQVASCDWLAMRTLGSLTPDEQKALFSGKELNVFDSSPQTKRCVQELVDRGLFSDPHSTRSSTVLIPLDTLEQTAMLPDGITNDATIGGTYIATPIASVPPPAGRSASNDDKRLPLADVVTDLAAGTPVEYGMAYTLDLKIHMWPSLYSGGLVTETYYMGVVKKFDDLPVDYRKSIERYMKH